MTMIKVTANKLDDGSFERQINLTEPNILGCSDLAELAAALGEDLCINQIKQQLKIAFRALIRRKMEEKDDNGDCTNSDESILAEDYSDWKPTLRITKTPEEKAQEALSALPPEVARALLANFGG